MSKEEKEIKMALAEKKNISHITQTEEKEERKSTRDEGKKKKKKTKRNNITIFHSNILINTHILQHI